MDNNVCLHGENMELTCKLNDMEEAKEYWRKACVETNQKLEKSVRSEIGDLKVELDIDLVTHENQLMTIEGMLQTLLQ
mgnify:CR=1 FL=1